MRFQDTLRFSLELLLPEKAVRAFEKITDISAGAVLSHAPTDVPSNRLRLLIEDIDRERYGGPTFGSDTISLMTLAVDRVIATLPQPVETQHVREVISCILSIAEDGERNPDRLRAKALAELERRRGI